MDFFCEMGLKKLGGLNGGFSCHKASRGDRNLIIKLLSYVDEYQILGLIKEIILYKLAGKKLEKRNF